MAISQAKPVKTATQAAVPIKTRTLWYDAWLRLKQNKIAVASAAILLILAAIALFYPIFEPTSYRDQVMDPATHRFIPYQAPSLSHLFGTDNFSRDVFSRVMYGTSISLSVGLVCELIILLIGMPLGLIAGYFGRGVDQVLML